MRSKIHVLAWAALLLIVLPFEAAAVVTIYFNPSQVATLVASGTTWDEISCQGYLFTYSRDKLFTGGGPTPIGRPVSVTWPTGIQAQFITTPTASNATITIQRVDGGVFDLTSFTAKLLANAGAGRSIEIVVMLNGQEPFPDPFYFDMTGVAGQSFSYDTSPNPYGTTAPLVGYDTYIVGLSLDYALTALTLTDPSTTGVEGRTPAAGDLLVAPNPAGAPVKISAVGGSWSHERLTVYSVNGTRVRSLVLDGSGRTTWDLLDNAGHHVVTGVYFVRMDSQPRAHIQRIVVVK